jgi:transcriptional regulator with XRE-family HTH domain
MSILKSNYFCFLVVKCQFLLYYWGWKGVWVMTDDVQKQIFSSNLNRLLAYNKKTQKEVADAIGVSPQTFNTWCKGIALPRMGKLQMIADYFVVNKSVLIEYEPAAVPLSTMRLTEREVEHIRKYRYLTDAGRDAVDNTLNFEYDRLAEQEGNVSSA